MMELEWKFEAAQRLEILFCKFKQNHLLLAYMKLLLTEIEAGSHLSWESHPLKNLTLKQVAGGANESVVMSHNRAVSNITSLLIILLYSETHIYKCYRSAASDQS